MKWKIFNRWLLDTRTVDRKGIDLFTNDRQIKSLAIGQTVETKNDIITRIK